MKECNLLDAINQQQQVSTTTHCRALDFDLDLTGHYLALGSPGHIIWVEQGLKMVQANNKLKEV